LDEWHVEGVRAEPAAAAQDEAVGVVRAGPRGPVRAVTIFTLLGHRLVLVWVPSPARACFIRNESPSVITVWQ
jgi:hypothetical protein